MKVWTWSLLTMLTVKSWQCVGAEMDLLEHALNFSFVLLYIVFISFFFKFFWQTHTHVVFWGPLIPCFGFMVMFPLGFKARVGSTLFIFMEANVMYIPRDLLLMLHLTTYWQPIWLPVASLNALAIVGVAWDWMNNHPDRMRTLCQQRNFILSFFITGFSKS